MQPLPIFATWRTEIAAQLDEAKAALADAQDEFTAANESAREAKIARRSMADAIDRLGARRPIAGAIAMRRRHHDDALNAADGRVTRARHAVGSAMAQIEDLQQALDQLDEIAPSPMPVEEPEAAAA